MTDLDLDLRTAEGELDELPGGDRVVLGVLDGSTPPEEWVRAVEGGCVLVLDVEGELTDLASGFAAEIKRMGGELMHFRGFLVVSPPGVGIDTDRLG